jgi:hypothetical protein
MRSRRLWTVGSVEAAGGDCASKALVVKENKSTSSQREPINLLLTHPETIPAMPSKYAVRCREPLMNFAA